MSLENNDIFELDNPHLKCKVDSYKRQNALKEIQDTESLESKFYLQTETIFDLKDCSPILQNNEPIDKKRVFSKSLQIAMVEDKKEVHEDDPRLNVEIRKNILNTKIENYESQLETIQDSEKINRIRNRKQIAEAKLETLKQLNQKKIFDN